MFSEIYQYEITFLCLTVIIENFKKSTFFWMLFLTEQF
jgi:hypothetical protein